MTLRELAAANIRCLQSVDLEPAQNNLIYGENASGKTSLLEAIFILGRGRSFRTANHMSVIRDGELESRVTGVVDRGGRQIRVGIALKRAENRQIRVDGRDQSSAAVLAEWVPVQIIDPEVHQLIDEGPGVRRRFLDWGVFHVEHRFLEAWRCYHRTVRQRNAVLKASRARELAVWDTQLAQAGEVLSGYRRRYVEALAEYVGLLGGRLLGEEITISYRAGWPEEITLKEALERSRERDLRQGVTHVGSHRSDLSVFVGSKRARGRVSRGQQKLAATALILAQLAHLRKQENLEGVLLLDDLPAELDKDRLRRVQEVVMELGAQTFVTTLEEEALRAWDFGQVFHVKQGKVRSVV